MTEYRMTIRHITDDGGQRRSCGVALYRGGSLIRTVEDLSPDAASVAGLVALFNAEGLDPVHLDQAIEDFLTDFAL